MQAIWIYANDCLWPKADIRTESKSVFVNVCFGEKIGRSAGIVNLSDHVL